MKKVTLILAALALVLGITQCKKQEKPVQIGEKQHIVLTANNGNDGSKVAVESATTKLNLTWEGNETINVSGGATGTLHYVSGEGATATFEGDIEIVSGELIEFHVGSLPVNYEGQAGTDVGLKSLIHLKGTSAYEDDGEYSALMELQFAVLKLDVSALGTTGELTIATGNTQIASVSDVASSSAGKEVFVAVPANGSKTEYTFKIGDKTVTKNWQLKQNTFYTLDEGSGTGSGAAIVIEPELLSGRFSVSATEYVQFSRGNLFCTDNGSDANPRYSFAFERNQYDFRNHPGKASMLNGVYSASGTPDNTSGAFQWDVSAAAPGKDYGAFGTEYPGTPADDATIDWGQAIGGNWYTMTREEMSYMVGYGSPEQKRPNYENLRKISKIVFSEDVSVNGYVFAPDNYDFTSHPLKSSYTESEWTQAEKEYGLVFFSCAGFHYNALAAGETGRYYLSKKPGDHLYFGKDENGYIGSSAGEYYCTSVRLVQRFEKPDVEPEFVDLGLPSGLLWANVNLGAKAYTGENSIGKSYMWGYVDNTIADDFDSYFNRWGGVDHFTSKYSALGTVLADEDDAAKHISGGSYRMPTIDEWKELRNNCTWTIMTPDSEYGVNGCRIKGSNGNEIFLPYTTVYQAEYSQSGACYYWSSSYSGYEHDYYLNIDYYLCSGIYYNSIYDMFPNNFNGYTRLPIRAVKKN